MMKHMFVDRYSSGNGSVKLVDLQAPAPTSTQTLPLPTELMTFKEESRGGVGAPGERVARPGGRESDEESVVEDADWNPGDLAWANINGFPYWPCTLTKDPDEHVFKKTKGRFAPCFILKGFWSKLLVILK
jgi:hypothetical protein